MSSVLSLSFATVISYLIGCLNPAYFMGKKKGMDIRSVGSHNAGASNAAIAFGMKAGAFTAIFDMLKSFFCYKIAVYFFPSVAFAGALCGCACIFGHNFPFYLRFKGGKGFASLGGLILAYNVKVFLIMLLGGIIVLTVSNYLCIVTTYASISFPFVYGFMTKDFIGGILILAIGAIIVQKHFVNFGRIKAGTECRFSGVFNREKEEERIRINSQKQND